MKKIILTLLILTIGSSAFAKPNYSYTFEPIQAPSKYSGTYIDEEMNIPVSQIGLPEQYTQPQVEEKGLEIEWNEWHAKVRNYIVEHKHDNIPSEYLLADAWITDRNSSVFFLIYTVHKTGKITDIILLNLYTA